MPSRLMIHIGPHKTASSYLQANFHAQRGRLKRGSWMYPALGIADGARAHHQLATDRAAFLDRPGPARAELVHLGRRARDKGFSLLFSSEAFSAWGPSDFAHFARLTGHERPELIYVLRDPVKRLGSYWAEEVKQGQVSSLPERAARELSDPSGSALLNPLIGLAPLLAADLPLHIVPYEHLAPLGEELFAHVTGHLLGIGGLGPVVSHRVNARLPLELTELLRFLTCEAGAEGSSALRQAFLSACPPPDQTILTTRLRAALPPPAQVVIPAKATFRRDLHSQLSRSLGSRLTLAQGQPLPEPQDVAHPYHPDRALWASAALRAEAAPWLTRLSECA